MSIFLAISLLVAISFVAFVVNVGLFVKAKINLQNAVDAGAWAGAAVQARQLTNMAYLNWEMRNTYKEWMFKYYVLGHMSRDKLKPSQVNNFGGKNNLDPTLFLNRANLDTTRMPTTALMSLAFAFILGVLRIFVTPTPSQDCPVFLGGVAGHISHPRKFDQFSIEYQGR